MGRIMLLPNSRRILTFGILFSFLTFAGPSFFSWRVNHVLKLSLSNLNLQLSLGF